MNTLDIKNALTQGKDAKEKAVITSSGDRLYFNVLEFYDNNGLCSIGIYEENSKLRAVIDLRSVMGIVFAY